MRFKLQSAPPLERIQQWYVFIPEDIATIEHLTRTISADFGFEQVFLSLQGFPLPPDEMVTNLLKDDDTLM
jgi:hypothetical protein